MGAQDESSSEDQGSGWGKSLPVESVQEIVRKDSRNIPHRYIREDVDRPKDTDLYPLQVEIPLIDLSLLSSDKDEREKLHQACKEWGFFQITNHGIAEDVLQRMKATAAAFFELPLEEKKMYSMASNDLQGYGQAYVVSEQQKLDWSDILFLMTLPIKDRKLNYWPTRVTSFMEAVDAYSTEINRVAKELFANLSLMMNMGKETLQRLHGEMKQAIRLNYYPICSRPELVLGVIPHSDCSTMSLLLQDDEVSALQIRHKGQWVPIEPIPRALVVNVGDIFKAWTNGMYKSIEHKAITNKKAARMSLATFILPDLQVEIGPLDEMVGDCWPRKYKKFKYLDYIRYTLDRKMEGKSHTQFMNVENE